MAITYNNLYLDIRQQLRTAGIEAATLEARELVCFATDKSREELYRDGALYASPELERRVRELVTRHLAGEPVAYLIGEWEFYGLPLDISPGGADPPAGHGGAGGTGHRLCPELGGVPGAGPVRRKRLHRPGGGGPGTPGPGGAGGVV